MNDLNNKNNPNDLNKLSSQNILKNLTAFLKEYIMMSSTHHRQSNLTLVLPCLRNIPQDSPFETKIGETTAIEAGEAGDLGGMPAGSSARLLSPLLCCSSRLPGAGSVTRSIQARCSRQATNRRTMLTCSNRPGRLSIKTMLTAKPSTTSKCPMPLFVPCWASSTILATPTF